METITLKELHQHTGRYARAASEQSYLITDRGHPVALLTAPVTAHMERDLPRQFSLDSVVVPKHQTDSAASVSAVRDER
ncbi:MAG: hypothetical protein QF689_09245 [Candidatus Latescibacteria bacterium]|jgi:antitoxin (DNA-binding transcriptional repressor) of toxin-antitoxin stability system|nr:hypothetical protein [Gemmatimonadaceae bacterium]MDP6015465.1 hypothetical protein [Candidatus Latescibacterota bacterium]MDP7448756.1 hypothetical protein [Candidatus Latescibacterota bacterium]HJP33286.1 hypothetical protein [Candidatus Latescibacterota bacterium]|tara:strand:- start:1518 stop:1754 length:237 start_codon:yes stop_codon:yes gene_type:complete